MNRITAIYIGRVGDVIVATSFLRAIRRRYQKARIRLIVGWRSGSVLPLIPFIDEWAVLGKPAHVGAHLRLAWKLFSEPCDLLIDLNSSFSKTSALIAGSVGAPRRLAFSKGRGAGAFTEFVPAPEEREHMAERYRRLAEALDAPYEQEPELQLPHDDINEAERLLSKAGATGGGFFRVVIHPGNFDRFSFRWPEEKFAQLSNRLLDDVRLQLFFMGGPGEHAKVAAIVRTLKRPVPILPPARLGVSGAMLSRMNLFICNITGTTHLAAALAVPTFGFYAGYTQAVWRPRGARHGGTVCPEWESCRETTVDKAHEALIEHIQRLRSIEEARQR